MSLKAPTAHQAIDDVDQAYGCCGLLHPKAAQHQMLTAPPAELSMLWEVTQHHTLTGTSSLVQQQVLCQLLWAEANADVSMAMMY